MFIRSFHRTALIPVLLFSNLYGCAFLRMRAEVKQLAKQPVVTGEVNYTGTAEGRLYAVVFSKEGPGRFAPTIREIPRESMKFVFLLDPGRYRLFVFHDLDDDHIVDPEEPLVLANGGTPLRFSEISPRINLRLCLDKPSSNRPSDIVSDLRRHIADANEPYHIAAGEPAAVSDVRFSPEAGELGLWRPHRFLRRFGMGIYMLTAYDPNKTPVLLVSGASGNLQSWSSFLAHLDRTRYQPWYYAYPSGIRLERSAEVLSALLDEIKRVYDPRKIVVIAHSMGGLVARGAVLEQLKSTQTPLIERLITISTPWGGHEKSEKGVSHLTSSVTAPIPAWIDMSRGSRYLQDIFYEKLSSRVPHNLIYTDIKGDGDGVVSKESQLLFEAISDAEDTRGFVLDHTAVLHNPGVIDYVERKFAAER